MNQPLVICKNIRKSFGMGDAKVEAVRGIDMEISKGETRLLMGPSGSGKTTLISIISGILTQDSGECLINGTDINRLPDIDRTAFRGHNIGFVFQSLNLVPTLTAEENISIPLIILGADKSQTLEKAKVLLSELGMADKVGKYPAQLSGGQKQRVAIGRAMIHDPALIICDEPTSFLDYKSGHKIMELLKGMITKRDSTLIIVTHDPRIEGFADKIDYLEDGKFVKTHAHA